MSTWRERCSFDPLPVLLSCGDEALVYHVRRDMLGEDPGPVDQLWELPAARQILKKQLPDGLWKVSYARPDEAEKQSMKTLEMKLWVSLAICRIFRRFYS